MSTKSSAQDRFTRVVFALAARGTRLPTCNGHATLSHANRAPEYSVPRVSNPCKQPSLGSTALVYCNIKRAHFTLSFRWADYIRLVCNYLYNEFKWESSTSFSFDEVPIHFKFPQSALILWWTLLLDNECLICDVSTIAFIAVYNGTGRLQHDRCS